MSHPLKDPMFRIEKDMLGEYRVPGDVLWGVHTARALDNFPVSGIPIGHFPNLVNALVMVKKAAANANAKLEYLPSEKHEAIIIACDAILAGQYHDHFVVDVIQGGAGTSTNMNTNEVIANIGLQSMGYDKGAYDVLHPIDDVNMSQSTNDCYPTSVRLSILLSCDALITALTDLSQSLDEKSVEFKDLLKLGRTQLQDAVPMTVGQEFEAFHITLDEEIERVREVSRLFCEVNLGATAIGTGINADSRYAPLVATELATISGFSIKTSQHLVEATSDVGAFVLFSGVLKRIAVKLSKLCNDLRLLSSGPRAGFGEINLPPVQAGSSIMPGKVNPVIPEVVNQIAFQVIGDDLSVTMAAEAGQLQLNAMEPLIAYKILNSMQALSSGMDILRTKCIIGITVNEERCRDNALNSIGLITALSSVIGYEKASDLAKQAASRNKTVFELLSSSDELSEQQLALLVQPESLTQPQRIK